VVVRGNKAKSYLISHGLRSPIDIITGSVNACRQSRCDVRDIHLIYVGQLSRIKQVDQFITIVDAVARVIPSVKAVIVGNGPLMTELQMYARQLRLTKEIEFLGQRKDVETLLARSKVFVLTSESEGLSIAMAEAMTAGVVPVVPDVGELGDLVIDGVNGYLVEPNNVSAYSARIISLLQKAPLWNQFSHRAAEDARQYCDLELVTEKWRTLLGQYVGPACDGIREMVE
jgi:glycosyltransferase involved in cell wall biosynthesis